MTAQMVCRPTSSGPRRAAAVAVEAGERVGAARFQRAAEHVAIGHLPSITRRVDKVSHMPSVTHIPGKPNLILGAYDIASVGYSADEFFVSGTASSYGRDGALGTADYTTRMVVLTPTDVAKFNGTVIVEWLNVSGGIDAPAFWFMAHREIVREGYAYVVVSAQQVGVQGGVSMLADMSLKTQDPERYSPLSHPGDAYSYDIFTPGRPVGP